MSTKEKDKTAETDEAEAKGGKKKLFLIVAGGAARRRRGAYFFLFSGGSAKAAAPAPAAPSCALDPVAVNLAGGGYLKVGVALQLTADGAAGRGRLDGSKAKDLVISTFSQAAPADVAGARDALKEALQQKIIKAYTEDGDGHGHLLHRLRHPVAQKDPVLPTPRKLGAVPGTRPARTGPHLPRTTRHTAPGRPAAPRRRRSGSVRSSADEWNVTTPDRTGPRRSRSPAVLPARSHRPFPHPQAGPSAAGSAPAAPATPAATPVDVPAGSDGRRRGEPRTYDFRRPTKLSREHVRVLQIAQEAFARQATTILTTFLRAGARLELVGIEQSSYDDYIVTLPNPVFISTFTPRAAGRQGDARLPARHRDGHRRPHARRLRAAPSSPTGR